MPPAAVPQPAPAGQATGPIAVPLMETGIQPRPQGVDGPSAPLGGQHPPVQQPVQQAPAMAQTGFQPRPSAAVAQAPAPVATAPRPARPKPHAAGPKNAQRNASRRQKGAPQATGAKQGNLLYTGAFIILATAVGAVLAKAILSFL
jgi:hypothetical protein